MQNGKFASQLGGLVKVLLVDAVGTLIHLHRPVAEYYAAAAAQFEVEVSPTLIRHRFPRMFRRYFTPWQEHLSPDWQARESAWTERNGEVDAWLNQEETARGFHQVFQLPVTQDTEESNWRSLVNSIFFEDGTGQPESSHSTEIKEALFRSLWETFARPDVWQVCPNAIPWVAELRSRGYLVCLASNFDSRLQDIIDGHRQSLVVDRIFVSSAVGFRKPDPRFYLAILQDLQVEPSNVMMVGDRWWEDYASPTVCGIGSCLYVPDSMLSGRDNPHIVSSFSDVIL